MSKKDYRRRPEHQALFNSKGWHEVKVQTFRRTNGLCERCLEEGIYTPGVDCHHIIPFESATSPDEMRRLFYDCRNIRLLCVPCHIRTHQELRSHTREQVDERKAQAAERRRALRDPNYEPINEKNNG